MHHTLLFQTLLRCVGVSDDMCTSSAQSVSGPKKWNNNNNTAEAKV